MSLERRDQIHLLKIQLLGFLRQRLPRKWELKLEISRAALEIIGRLRDLTVYGARPLKRAIQTQMDKRP